jgi:group I intron endonuclease
MDVYVPIFQYLDNKMIGIYQIRNIVDNKLYIGSSYDLRERIGRHRRALKKNQHGNKHLQLAWNIYGELNFAFEIIEILTDTKNILEREQYWIDKTMAFSNSYGYNMAKYAGSPMKGIHHTEENKQKISRGMKGINKGRPITQEQKDQISRTLKGRMSGSSNPFFGKCHSPEMRKHLSNKRKGKVPGNKGKKFVNGRYI